MLAGKPPKTDADLRARLLAFIGDFADWDNSSHPVYLEIGRSLVKAAHPDETPLVVDPFAGGGSIPLEALRLGCDTFASDLNPVAVLLNKVRQQITSLMDRRLSHRITRSDYAVEWKASKSNEAEFKRRVALLTSEIIRRQAVDVLPHLLQRREDDVAEILTGVVRFDRIIRQFLLLGSQCYGNTGIDAGRQCRPSRHSDDGDADGYRQCRGDRRRARHRRVADRHQP